MLQPKLSNFLRKFPHKTAFAILFVLYFTTDRLFLYSYFPSEIGYAGLTGVYLGCGVGLADLSASVKKFFILFLLPGIYIIYWLFGLAVELSTPELTVILGLVGVWLGFGVGRLTKSRVYYKKSDLSLLVGLALFIFLSLLIFINVK